MTERCQKQNRNQLTVSREIGRLLGQNTRGGTLVIVATMDKNVGLLAKHTWIEF
jgi:hypothetical protein